MIPLAGSIVLRYNMNMRQLSLSRASAHASRAQTPSKAQYAAIAAFRYQLRLFLAFSAAAAAALGLPPQQHQALLAIAGWNDGEPTIGALAKKLLIAPHTAAELVTRMTRDGLVTKRTSRSDRRKTELALTRKATAILNRLTEVHLQELRTLAPSLISALGQQRRKRASRAPN